LVLRIVSSLVEEEELDIRLKEELAAGVVEGVVWCLLSLAGYKALERVQWQHR